RSATSAGTVRGVDQGSHRAPGADRDCEVVLDMDDFRKKRAPRRLDLQLIALLSVLEPYARVASFSADPQSPQARPSPARGNSSEKFVSPQSPPAARPPPSLAQSTSR